MPDNFFDQFDGDQQQVFRREQQADITQSEASAESSRASAGSSRASAETTNATRDYVVRKAAADAAAAEAAAEKAASDLAQAKRDAGGDDRRRATIDMLLGEVKSLYNQDIKGQPISRLGGLTEYIPALPKNERFTQAGNSILPMIRPLVAQTAREGDSDKEMEIFKSYIPSAGNSDITIEQKMKMLELMIGGMIDGKAPSQTYAEKVVRDQSDDQGNIIYSGDDGEGGLGGVVTDEGPSGPSDGGGQKPASYWFEGIPLLEGNYSPESLAKGIGGSLGDIVEGVAGIPGIIANPVNAAINAVTGSKLSTDIGVSARRAAGLPDNSNETASAINKFGAAALTGGGLPRLMSKYANPGAVKSAIDTLGRTPIRDAAAGTGAGLGSQVGKESGVPGGELLGALIGGIGGYGASGGLQSLASKYKPTDLAKAAERQGVDLLPADAGGDFAKIMTSGAKVSPLSAAPIRDAAQRSQQQMSRAAGRMVPEERATTDQVGEMVRRSAERYAETTSRRGDTLYKRAENLSKGVKSIKPSQTLAAIDAQIARMEQNPAATPAMLGELRAFKEKISQGVSIQGLRDARTQLSAGVYDGQLRSGVEQGMWKNILSNIADDIDTGLRSVGREGAADAFKRADRFWSERAENIDKVLQPIIGRDGQKGGEQIVQTIEGMARGQTGGNARLSRLMGNLDNTEAQQVRGTIIDRMGRATPGNQDATSEAFSSSTFLSNWSKFTPQAKRSLFPDAAHRQTLDDIALLADKMRASQKMANHSNTALAQTGNVGAALGVSYALGPAWATLSALSTIGTGRLLASPRFARMIARTAEMPEAQARRTISQQLGILGAREPALRQDAQSLQSYLSQSFGQSPIRAAAREEEEN